MNSSTKLDASKTTDGIVGDNSLTEAKQISYIKVDGKYPLSLFSSSVFDANTTSEAPKFDLESYIANYKGIVLVSYLRTLATHH